MIAYASNTGTRRNLDVMRKAGWRILLTPDNPLPREYMRFAIDNGAWSYFQKGLPFDTARFENLVERFGACADFIILPDIVAGGMESLALSVSWISRLRHIKQLLLPIQDGMTAEAVGKILRQHMRVGLFLGGSTEYKLREMYAWGMVAAAWNRWYHVGRVNSAKRIRLCEEAGATSFDGTSVTRYAVTLPNLDNARKQANLFSPVRNTELEPS